MHTFRTGTRTKRWLERLAVLVAASALLTPAYGQTGGFGQGGTASPFGSPVPPARDPNQTPPGGLTGAPGAATETRPDLTLNVNDTFQLRHDSGKPIKDVVISRPGVVELTVLEGTPEKNTTLNGRALTPGLTTIVLTAHDTPDVTRKTIQVIPDVKFIESLLIKTFPTANIKLIPGSAANSLIATGTVESSEDVDPVLRFLSAFTNNDRSRVTNALRVSGVMQVQLEVCVARVNRSELRSMGLNFLFADRQNFLGSGIGNIGALSSTGSAALRGGSPLVPIASLTAPAGGPQLQFGITDSASGFLGYLQALHNEGLNKIMANPTLVTTSGRVAEFLVGGEQVAAVAGGATSGSTLQFRAFGTRLAFLPFVLGDGRLRLVVLTEVSQPAGTITTPNIVAPNFTVNRVHTAVEMENRQTLILGGIIQNEINATTNKVPVLGDLPFVGAAFRSVTHTENETEVVIMVTAHLSDPLDASQVAGYRLPGQETRPPTDFELFLEGIMEAPRGPRDPFPGNRYVAAHKLAPHFGVPQGQCYPETSFGSHGHGNLFGGHLFGNRGCNTGCGTGYGATSIAMPQTTMMAPDGSQMQPAVMQHQPLPLPNANIVQGSNSGMTPPPVTPVNGEATPVVVPSTPATGDTVPASTPTIPVVNEPAPMPAQQLPPVEPPAPPSGPKN